MDNIFHIEKNIPSQITTNGLTLIDKTSYRLRNMKNQLDLSQRLLKVIYVTKYIKSVLPPIH